MPAVWRMKKVSCPASPAVRRSLLQCARPIAPRMRARPSSSSCPIPANAISARYCSRGCLTRRVLRFRRAGESLFLNLATQRLQLAALSFTFDQPFNRTSARLGCGALPGRGACASDQSLKPRKRILPVLLLAAIALRLDDDYPVAGDTPVG